MNQLIGCVSGKIGRLAVGVGSQVKLLDMNGRRLAVAKESVAQWQAIVCTADGARVAAVGAVKSRQSLLCAWRLEPQRFQLLWKKPLDFTARLIACSETTLVVASSDTLLLLRWATGETIRQIRLPQPMLCALVQADAVWLGDERGNLWRVQNQEVRKVANFGVGEIFCIDATQDTLYLGSADTLIHTYNIQKAQAEQRMLGHRSEVACIACKPQQLVSVGLQGDISLWNPTAQYPDKRLLLNGELPTTIACSSTGETCWVLLSNGLHQVDWAQSRARLTIPREKITTA